MKLFGLGGMGLLHDPYCLGLWGNANFLNWFAPASLWIFSIIKM